MGRPGIEKVDVLSVLADSPEGLHAYRIAALCGWTDPKVAHRALKALHSDGLVVSLPDPLQRGSQTRMRWCLPEHIDAAKAAIERDRKAESTRGSCEILPSSDPRCTPSRDRVWRDPTPPQSIFRDLKPGQYEPTGSAIERAYS